MSAYAPIDSVQKRATVNVYAAGGGGTNIVFDVESWKKTASPGFALMNPCYVDTSRSNIFNKKLSPDEVYLFADMDGSGKVRSSNAGAISKGALAVLQKFKPTDFNIVVHTASGG